MTHLTTMEVIKIYNLRLIWLQYDYDYDYNKKLTCSFFACVELRRMEAGAHDMS